MIPNQPFLGLSCRRELDRTLNLEIFQVNYNCVIVLKVPTEKKVDSRCSYFLSDLNANYLYPLSSQTCILKVERNHSAK